MRIINQFANNELSEIERLQEFQNYYNGLNETLKKMVKGEEYNIEFLYNTQTTSPLDSIVNIKMFH